MEMLQRQGQGGFLLETPTKEIGTVTQRCSLKRARSSGLLLQLCMFGLLIASYFSLSDLARAEGMTIVALGASNTVGRSGASYPAELEALLKAKGYDVRVINAGVNGDTTAGMAARLDLQYQTAHALFCSIRRTVTTKKLASEANSRLTLRKLEVD